MNNSLVYAVLVGLGLTAGCEKSPEPNAEVPLAAEGNTAPTSTATATGIVAPAQSEPRPQREAPREIARVELVELFELHRDTFPESLAEAAIHFSGDDADQAIVLTDKGLFLDREAAADPARRGTGLRLAPDVARLEEARVVVAYRRRFEGVGRQGGSITYLVFARLPVDVPLPARYPAADRWEFDMTADGAFPSATRAITAYPPELKHWRISSGPQPDRLTMSAGDAPRELVRDQPLEITNATRTLEVSEKPVVADFVGAAGAEQGVEVVPRQDHGRVTFTTRLIAVYRGERPLWIGSHEDAAVARTGEKAP